MLALIATVLASTGYAATVRYAPVDELAAHSAVIFHGVVRTIDEDLSTSKDGPFLTRVELEVLTAVQGCERGDIFAFTLLGGVAGDRRMVVPGMPRFTANDEVVLLLERTPTGYVPTGLQQGVFDVLRGDPSRVVARQRLEGARVLGREDARAPATIPLGDLVAQLSAAVSGAR